MPADFQFKKFDVSSNDNEDDIFHPNDVEVLPSAIADKFPDFRAGDLLVSFRNIHLVAILDGGDKSIKWWRRGPWRFQHDPDFTPDGRIRVYNNNTDRGRSDATKDGEIVFEFNNLINKKYNGVITSAVWLPTNFFTVPPSCT